MGRLDFFAERRNAVRLILRLDEIGVISFEVLIHNSDSANWVECKNKAHDTHLGDLLIAQTLPHRY